MTRDEIYDHLAKVYLGKKTNTAEQKKRQLNSWLIINIVTTIIIFASAFYGLTAFLARRGDVLQNKIIYALNNGPIRINYNLTQPYPPVKTFSLAVPEINVLKYSRLQFTIRGLDNGTPGVVRVSVRNHKNETASVLIEHVNSAWQNYSIPFSEFQQISDWTTIEEVSFILESWNADKKKGTILLDDICFSS